MSLISKLHLTSRRGIMPGVSFGSVTLYRINAMDKIKDTKSVCNVEVMRWPSKSDSPGQDKPSKTRGKTFHFWVDQLGDWVIKEFDIINYGCEWWAVKDATLEMADTRWRVNCVESKDPR